MQGFFAKKHHIYYGHMAMEKGNEIKTIINESHFLWT